MMISKILRVAEQHNFDVSHIEHLAHGDIAHGIGIKKLEAMREQLLAEGHDRPISCHRQDGSSEAFMILWK